MCPIDLANYAQDIVLADGRTVHVRPIRPDDLEAMRELWHRLSPETIRLRFFAPLTLDDLELRDLVEVDNVNRFALVAEVHDQIVAVARFDRLPEDPRTADFGITVEDAQQGRGLGTALMRALLQPARDLGITAFHGDILKDNASMLAVMHDAGFEPVLRDYGDMVTATFETTPTETLLDRAGEMGRRAARNALAAVFNPSSIAVVGASRDPSHIGALVLNNLLRDGFSGVVYPVNPNTDHVHSIAAYPSLEDCPTVPDLVVCCVPAPLVKGVVDRAGALGVRAAVLVGTGFSESGEEGRVREQQVLATARRHGIRLIGPNCMGVYNAAEGVSMNATFAPVTPPPGRIGLSSQSGALGMAILAAARRRGLGLSTFASIGNKVDISSNDLLQYWEADDATDILVLYLDSFGNPRTFARVARRVGRRKPIVAVKAGRRGTDDEVVQAMFDATGVIRVPSLEVMFAVTSLLASQPLPAGPRVGVISNGAGPALLAADACEAEGLQVPPLDATASAAFQALPTLGAATNPLRLRGDATAADVASAVRTLARTGVVDALLVIYTSAQPAGTEGFATRLAEVAGTLSVPLIAVVMAGDDPPEQLRRANIPVTRFPEEAAAALGHAARYAAWRGRPLGNIVSFPDADTEAAAALIDEALAHADAVQLTAGTANELLAAYRVPLAAQQIVQSPDEVASALEALPVGPVVVKPAAQMRKAELGAVRLGLVGVEEVRKAVEEVRGELHRADRFEAEAAGWVIEEMIPDGVEVTISISSDPMFGPVLGVGLGGTDMELLADRAVKVLPLTDRDVDELLQGLRGYPLLAGHRGGRAVSVVALRLLLLRLSAMVENHPEIHDVELSPVFVRRTGVVVVDAKVRLRTAGTR